MKDRPNLLGVYIGAFNPIHYGHLSSAEIARQVLGINRVLFVPNYVSPTPHKNITVDFVHRCNMIQLAIDNYPHFLLDRRSAFLSAPSYAIDTLTSLKKEFNVPLCLMMGNDVMAHFHQWDRYEEILELAHIAVMRTPHESIEFNNFKLISSDEEHFLSILKNNKAGKVFLINECQGVYASSTFIRNLVEEGLAPHFQTSPEVLKYIAENELYV